MVCPDPRANFSDQPLIGVVPVLVTVMLSVRPVFHALTELVTRQAPVPPWELDELGLGDGVRELDGLALGDGEGLCELEELGDGVLPPGPALTVMLELPLLW